jgi:hypothetical protein
MKRFIEKVHSVDQEESESWTPSKVKVEPSRFV